MGTVGFPHAATRKLHEVLDPWATLRPAHLPGEKETSPRGEEGEKKGGQAVTVERPRKEGAGRAGWLARSMCWLWVTEHWGETSG